jgi:ABC-2 type transport system ATP-binding protein
LTKRFGRVLAVDGVSFEVPPGQVFALLGPNGAGKTATIKMMLGLVSPTAGTASLGGYDIAAQRSRAVGLVGAVLEGSRNVYWPLSAWQNLLYFGRLKGLGGAEIRPRAQRLLTELGLWDRRHETVGSYSRGMQQKVAVAAALITDPPILLLDEPTIGLDVEAARTVKDWIAKLARDQGKTILLTTHQLPIAQELAGRIAVIRDGQIIADLPTPELLSRYAEDRFEVRVRTAGMPNEVPGALPPGARIEPGQDATRILLPDTDQAVLGKVLDGLRAANLPLLSVSQAQPGLEEVFLRLIRPGDRPGDGDGDGDGRAAAAAADASRGEHVA